MVGAVTHYVHTNLEQRPPRYDFPALPYDIEEEILRSTGTEEGEASACAGALLTTVIAKLASAEAPIGIEVYYDRPYGILMARVRTVAGAAIEHAAPLPSDRATQLITSGIEHLVLAEREQKPDDGFSNPLSTVSIAAGTSPYGSL